MVGLKPGWRKSLPAHRFSRSRTSGSTAATTCRNPSCLQPVYGLAVHAEKRGDDVKLTGSISKLIDEDPTLQLEQNAELREMVLWGQGDVHLQIAIDRLRNRHNLAVIGHPRGGALQGDDPPRQPSSIRGSSGNQGRGQPGSSPTARST